MTQGAAGFTSPGHGSDSEEPDPSTLSPTAKRRKKNTLDLSDVPTNVPAILSNTSGSASRFKGVSMDKKKWRAEISFPSKAAGMIHLGNFDSDEAAGMMFARARYKYPVAEGK